MTPAGMQKLAIVLRAGAATLAERAQLVRAAQAPRIETPADFTGPAQATYETVRRRAGMT